MQSMNDGEGPIWATAVSKHRTENRAIVFRFLKEFASDFDRSTQPDRIILVWEYESESGMPSSKERERMDELEDLLSPHVERDGFSTLALVSTGEGLREWIYYARSEEEFLNRLNEALYKEPAFPIEIHTASDPDWTSYEDFRAGVKEKDQC